MAILSMVRGGAKYIYSNDPESIEGVSLGSTNGRYTIEVTLQPNIDYHTEFYHLNVSGGTLRIGIAVQNGNSTSQQIRVKSKAIATGGSPYSQIASGVTRDYGNSSNDQYITIPGNGTILLHYADVLGGNMVNGKVKFATGASNLKVRVFFARTSVSTNNIFNLPRATSDGKQRTTGFFNYDTRYANVNASTVSNFYLSAYQDNINEYETGTNVLGSQKLLGNYGIIYDLQFQNASGKRLRITPNEQAHTWWTAQIVLWTSNNQWYRTTEINKSSSTKYWLMAIPADQKIRYILPGGNYGNIFFEIIN